MKAGSVAQLVGAVADRMKAQVQAENVTNDIHGLKLRTAALENLVGTMAEIMLSGTSADPEAATAPAAKKARK